MSTRESVRQPLGVWRPVCVSNTGPGTFVVGYRLDNTGPPVRLTDLVATTADPRLAVTATATPPSVATGATTVIRLRCVGLSTRRRVTVRNQHGVVVLTVDLGRARLRRLAAALPPCPRIEPH